MVTDFLVKTVSFIFSLLERMGSRKYWVLKSTLIIFVLSLFMSFPRTEIFTFDYTLNSSMARKLEHPLMMQQGTPERSHAAKLAFRLTVPVFAHLFRLNIFICRILEAFSGGLLIIFSLLFFMRVLQDKVSAFLGALIVASLYACNGSFIEYRCFFDVFGILFLLLAIYFRNSLLIFSCVFLASWCDERALIASSFVFLFHFFNKKKLDEPTAPLSSCFQKENIAVMFSWVAYFALRFFLASRYGLKTDTRELFMLGQINNFPMGLWTALEGGWLLVILAFTALLLKRRFLLLAAGLFFIMISTFVAIMVTDITRSMAYLLPVLFISARILHETETLENLRRYLLLAALIAFFAPNFYVKDKNQVWWFSPPAPLQVMRIFLVSGNNSQEFE